MSRLSTLSHLFAAALVGILAVSAQAQSDAPQNAQAPATTRLKVHVVPAAPAPTPFPAGSETPAAAAPIEFRSPDQMNEKDRLLAADGESSIGEHIAWLGMNLNEGNWTYEQVVCPALPNHIFLKYTRNGGPGDVSVFTAAIPRAGDGRVRIIPIQMRGYSLFSPAPINALTISAFNHIRAEENPDKAPDWIGTGLCYAALAGYRFQNASAQPDDSAKPDKRAFPTAVPAMLQLPPRGGAVIEFSTVAENPPLTQWTMTFDRKGRLLKATHQRAGYLTVNIVPAAPAQIAGTPMPSTIQEVDASGNVITEAQSKANTGPAN
jgi:hypothetical protein